MAFMDFSTDSEFAVSIIMGDEVAEISQLLGISEFEVFCKAAQRWGIPLHRVKEDFNFYLMGSEAPPYVRDMLRISNDTPASA